MIVIPAIDIKDGKVVRLKQGDFDTVTLYSNDPVTTAQRWESKGAKFLHVVDLDGARTGKLKNSDIVLEISRTVRIPVQTGGGIRRKEDILKFLSRGISRVVLGTKAIEDRNFLTDMIKDFPEKIVVSLDCHQGKATQKGWTATTSLEVTNFAKELESLGLKHIVYTDIVRDGMLSGPNIPAVKELLESVSMSIIASGGISNIEDIRTLRKLGATNLEGVIVGKALYETRLDLEEALTVCSQKE